MVDATARERAPAKFSSRKGDAALVEAARAGDQIAFRRLVERYQSAVCSIGLAVTGSLAHGEEVAQETFVAAWQGLVHLRDPASFKGWLLGIAHNQGRRVQRRQKRVERAVTQDPRSMQAERPSPDPSPLDRAIAREEAGVIERALAAIPEVYREPLILFYREDRSVETVAELMGLSPNNVKTRLCRGRKMLQEHVLGLLEVFLERTKPGKGFTAAVLIAIGTALPKQAPAASTSRLVVLGAAAATALVIPVLYGSRPEPRPPTPAGEMRAGPGLSRPPLASSDTGAGRAASVAAGISESSSSGTPGVLFNFDFEDGLLREGMSTGYVSRCPSRPGNEYCLMGTLMLGREPWDGRYPSYAGFRNQFSYAEDLVLAFDYWVDADDEPLQVDFTNADKKGIFRARVANLKARTWAHAVVRLNEAASEAARPLQWEPGDSIAGVQIISVGRLKPFYVDNLRLFADAR